ncbi:MAG: protein kinase [Polyangiales bacterium]
MVMPAKKLCMRCGSEFESNAVFCPHDGARLVPQSGANDPMIGSTLLDQFLIEAAIGTGGMGTVYRATQTSVGREVAIKVLRPELVENEDAVRRFQREARLATSLDHPNLVRVLLSGQLPDGRIYIVMELLVGRSLDEVLEAEPVLDLGRVVNIVMKLCAGIDAVHAEGIVHRDIKPENIFLVKRKNDPDFVKVVDFGIARMLESGQSTLTQSGRVFGTASYISPEGAAGEPTDFRSDVYSIAVLAYQLLTGVLPFDAPNPGAVLMQHVHNAPPDLRSVGEGQRVPPELAAVVMRSLSKNPDARHQSVAEFVESWADAAAQAGLVQDGRALLLGTMWSDELTSPGTSISSLLGNDPIRARTRISDPPPPPTNSSNPPRDSTLPFAHTQSMIPPEDEAILSIAPDPFAKTEPLELRRSKMVESSKRRGWVWPALAFLAIFGVGAFLWKQVGGGSSDDEITDEDFANGEVDITQPRAIPLPEGSDSQLEQPPSQPSAPDVAIEPTNATATNVQIDPILIVTPTSPSQGELTKLSAIVSPDVSAIAPPDVLISLDGKEVVRLKTIPGTIDYEWVAEYVFAESGKYLVAVMPGGSNDGPLTRAYLSVSESASAAKQGSKAATQSTTEKSSAPSVAPPKSEPVAAPKDETPTAKQAVEPEVPPAEPKPDRAKSNSGPALIPEAPPEEVRLPRIRTTTEKPADKPAAKPANKPSRAPSTDDDSDDGIDWSVPDE